VQAVLGFDARRFQPADREKFLGWKIWCAQLDAVRGRDLMAGTYRAWQRGTLAQKPILLSLHSGDPVEDQDEPGREMHDARLISPWPDPEALAIAADEARAGRRRLRGWLARLSHRDRLLLIARYGHGRRLIAIGREHGIGESRVSHLADRALRAVRAAAA
jgi:DNA-directed RNA polymerase specialized sigma24 family protein